VAGERRAAIQVNQIHRTANQITDARTHAIENRRWQAGNRQIEIGGGITRPMCSRAKDVNLLGLKVKRLRNVPLIPNN
jgi:hypothetical protein